VVWENLNHPVQVVLREVTLPVEELHFADDIQARAQLHQMCQAGQHSLSLVDAPLLRIRWTELADGSCLALLLVHHLISDHVGLEIVMRELAAWQHDGGKSLLPAAPYREYVAQSQCPTMRAEAKAYFTERLSDVEEMTAPFSLTNIHGDGSRIHEARRQLDGDISVEIRSQMKRRGMSPAVFFHAAWALLLAHCSGRSDVVFGTVLSGRLQGTRGVTEMLGVFINTLPLRIKLSKQTGSELIEQVSGQLAKLLEFEQYPLSEAQKCSGIAHATPLFSAILNYRRSTSHQNLANETSLLDSREYSNYPLDLSIDDLDDDFIITIQVEQMDASLILDYLDNATRILICTLNSEDRRPLIEYPILLKEELMMMSANSIENKVEISDRFIHHVFEQVAKSSPTDVALIFRDISYSYAELNANVNRLSHCLIEDFGVKAGDRVGILMERSPQAILSILACLKVGACYVALNPDYPVNRLKSICDDCNFALIIVSGNHVSDEVKESVTLVDLSNKRILDRLSIASSENPSFSWNDLCGDLPAYTVFTSGSTGKPKGVVCGHKGLVNLSLSLKKTYGLNSKDRVLQFAPLSFDMSVEEIFGALCSGACLVLRDDSWIDSVEDFYRMCASFQITVLNLPTAFWRELSIDPDPPKNHDIRMISIGGEEVKAQDTIEWFKRHSENIKLWNAYGPSEYTVNASIVEIRPDIPIQIGTAISNTTMAVLGLDLNLLPCNVPGELCLSGFGLSLGYLGLEELNRDRFVEIDVYGDGEKRKFYRTGDLVQRNERGEILFLGRIDHQIKIRGFRIELGEIENTAMRLPGIVDACVIPVIFSNTVQLHLCVVVESQHLILDTKIVGDWVQLLSKELPHYMLPQRVERFLQFPKTPNGKTDKQKLKYQFAESITKQSVQPKTRWEAEIANIWCEILEVDQIGRDDSFFDLGGHSLLATRFVSRFNAKSAIRITVSHLFEQPQLSRLAEFVENLERIERLRHGQCEGIEEGTF